MAAPLPPKVRKSRRVIAQLLPKVRKSNCGSCHLRYERVGVAAQLPPKVRKSKGGSSVAT